MTADGSRGGYRMKSGEGINFEKSYQQKYLNKQNYGHVPLPVLHSNRKENQNSQEDNKCNPLPVMTNEEALSFSLAAKNSTIQE